MTFYRVQIWIYSRLIFQVIKIKKEIKRHSDSSNSSDRSQIRSITTMALVLSAVFFSCNVLDCIWWMLTHTNNVNSAIFHCLKEFFETLSSSVNVLIFGVFGQKFRNTFFRLFCPCKKTKDYNQIPMKDRLTRKLTMETNC